MFGGCCQTQSPMQCQKGSRDAVCHRHNEASGEGCGERMSLPDAGLPTSSCRNRRPSDRSHAPALNARLRAGLTGYATCKGSLISTSDRSLAARSLPETTPPSSRHWPSSSSPRTTSSIRSSPSLAKTEMAFGEATFRNTVEQIAANPLTPSTRSSPSSGTTACTSSSFFPATAS